MPLIFHDTESIANALRLRFNRPSVIAIDGWTGVGKTTLASTLADKFDGDLYDTDSALQRDEGRYFDALRLHEIEAALREARGFLFVSGILMRKILQSISFDPAAHIYVKRMATWGWADEDELIAGRIPEIDGASGVQLRRELRSYHGIWHPQLIADYEMQISG